MHGQKNIKSLRAVEPMEEEEEEEEEGEEEEEEEEEEGDEEEEYIPNRKVYMINFLPFLCFSPLTVPASCDASASTGVFPSASFDPQTSPPLLALPPLNSAVLRCKAKGYKPLSLSSKRVAVCSKLRKRNVSHFMKFEVKYDFIFLQNVSFVIISLFCTWDSDIWSVLAACLFVC